MTIGAHSERLERYSEPTHSLFKVAGHGKHYRRPKKHALHALQTPAAATLEDAGALGPSCYLLVLLRQPSLRWSGIHNLGKQQCYFHPPLDWSQQPQLEPHYLRWPLFL
jgi:hypothetical protein